MSVHRTQPKSTWQRHFIFGLVVSPWFLALDASSPTNNEACAAIAEFAPNSRAASMYEGCSGLCYFPQRNPVGPTSLPQPVLDLSNKLVYFWGDSTTRQVWAAFLAMAVMPGNEPAWWAESSHSFQAVRGHTRSCPSQRRPHLYVPQGPNCFWNENTCTDLLQRSRFGTSVTIMNDWKHYLYEDYDRELLRRWTNGSAPVPDLLIVGPGLVRFSRARLFVLFPRIDPRALPKSPQHDCVHRPHDVLFHARQMRTFAEHLATVPGQRFVVWMDIVPHRSTKLSYNLCRTYLNELAIELAVQHGWQFFGRSHYLLNHPRSNFSDIHHPDVVIDEIARLVALQVGCPGGSTRLDLFAALGLS